MNTLLRNRWWTGTALVAAIALTWSALQAQFELAGDFTANERDFLRKVCEYGYACD